MFTQLRSNLKFLGSILFAITFLVGGFFVANSANAEATLVLTAQPTATITRSALVSTTGTQSEINTAVDAAIIGLTAIPVTLANTSGTASANVRISPIGANSHIQLWARDTSRNWFNINVTGYIDPAGMVVPGGYSLTTNVYAISDTTGDYLLTVKLVNAVDGALITSTTGTVTVNAPAATTADFITSLIDATTLGSALANGPETIDTGATQSAIVGGVINVTGAIRAKNSNVGIFAGSTAGPAIAQYILFPSTATSMEEFKTEGSGTKTSLGGAAINTDSTNTDRGWFDYTKHVFRMGVYLYSGDTLRNGDLTIEFVFKDAGGTIVKDVSYILRFETTMLATAKTDAHDALTAALATYTQGNYTAENWTTLTGFKITGDTAIDAATTLAGITSAQGTATTGMSGVAVIPQHNGNSGSSATPAVPAKKTTPPADCLAGQLFSEITGRNCNAATPAIPAGQVLGASTQAGHGQVLGAEKFNFTKFLKFKAGSYKVSLQGPEVIELQKFLATLGYDIGIADGKFGVKTNAAVIKFQISKGLKGDGVIGALTREALNK